MDPSSNYLFWTWVAQRLATQLAYLPGFRRTRCACFQDDPCLLACLPAATEAPRLSAVTTAYVLYSTCWYVEICNATNNKHETSSVL